MALTSFLKLNGEASFSSAHWDDGLGQHMVGECEVWGVEGAPPGLGGTALLAVSRGMRGVGEVLGP